MEGSPERLYLEILRVPFWKLPRNSQLMQFRYSANDRNLTDQRVVSRGKDTILCDFVSHLDPSMFALIVIRNTNRNTNPEENRSVSTYFYSPAESKLLELCANGTFLVSTVSPLSVASVSVALPALDFGSSLIYAGNLSSLSLISRKQHLSSLPLGSLSTVEEQIHRVPLTRHYRKLCYSLFLEAAQDAPVRSNQTFSHTIPYLAASVLFEDPDAIAARLVQRNDNFTFFSEFTKLVEASLNDSNTLHVAFPARRTITCRIDTEIFRSNPYYRQRMENRTWVHGELLRMRGGEKEANDTVYEVRKDAVRELRYVIEVEEEREEATLILAVDRDTVQRLAHEKCAGSSQSVQGETGETGETGEPVQRGVEETCAESSQSVQGETGETGETPIPRDPVSFETSSDSTESTVSSRRLSTDWLLDFIVSHRDSIVPPFPLFCLTRAGLHQSRRAVAAAVLSEHHVAVGSASFPFSSSP